MDNKINEWNNSYQKRDNFIFYPHEEIIRFVSKYICKRIGLNEFKNMSSSPRQRILDVGCGIGRHIVFCNEMGLDAYGIDLSSVAINTAHEFLEKKNINGVAKKVVQGDIRKLPWEDGYFDFAISHGVLDSMPFEIARDACRELSKKLVQGGLFYCDLVAGDDSAHAREFAGEEIVSTEHEKGTVQGYFNLEKIKLMIENYFEISECFLIRREEIIKGGYISRYHVILRKI